MSETPDVLGLKLEDALPLLQAAGFRIIISETAPPRGPVRGGYRVVKAVFGDKDVELIVARQGWDEPEQ